MNSRGERRLPFGISNLTRRRPLYSLDGQSAPEGSVCGVGERSVTRIRMPVSRRLEDS